MIATVLTQIEPGGLNATLRAVRDQFQDGGSIAIGLLLIAGFLTVGWVVNLLARRQSRAQATTLPSDPGRLFAELLPRLGLTPDQSKALKHVARDLRLANPATILVSPTLFDQGVERWQASRPSAQSESQEPATPMTEIRATLFPGG